MSGLGGDGGVSGDGGVFGLGGLTGEGGEFGVGGVLGLSGLIGLVSEGAEKLTLPGSALAKPEVARIWLTAVPLRSAALWSAF